MSDSHFSLITRIRTVLVSERRQGRISAHAVAKTLHRRKLQGTVEEIRRVLKTTRRKGTFPEDIPHQGEVP